MAAVVTTLLRARQQENGVAKEAAAAAPPQRDAEHCQLHHILAIQRVFRGYRDRKKNSKDDLVIDPTTMLVSLDRHYRERRGFKQLCWFVLYLLLYIMVVWSRSHSTNRFHLESAVIDAISGVTTSSGATVASAASPAEVYVSLSQYPCASLTLSVACVTSALRATNLPPTIQHSTFRPAAGSTS